MLGFGDLYSRVAFAGRCTLAHSGLPLGDSDAVAGIATARYGALVSRPLGGSSVCRACALRCGASTGGPSWQVSRSPWRDGFPGCWQLCCTAAVLSAVCRLDRHAASCCWSSSAGVSRAGIAGELRDRRLPGVRPCRSFDGRTVGPRALVIWLHSRRRCAMAGAISICGACGTGLASSRFTDTFPCGDTPIGRLTIWFDSGGSGAPAVGGYLVLASWFGSGGVRTCFIWPALAGCLREPGKRGVDSWQNGERYIR